MMRFKWLISELLGAPSKKRILVNNHSKINSRVYENSNALRNDKNVTKIVNATKTFLVAGNSSTLFVQAKAVKRNCVICVFRPPTWLPSHVVENQDL